MDFSPWELRMRENETFQPNGELDVTTAHHVLDLEIDKLGLEVMEMTT